MKKYTGKKILVLAGKPIGSMDIVEYAQFNGAYTIVTDNLSVSQSPAKTLADEIWDISTAEVEVLSEKIKEHKIDAVFTGVHEFNIWRNIDISESTALPFYATREQMFLTSIKNKYKQLFKTFGIPVIDEYRLREEFFEDDLRQVEYPVLIKPVDGSGGYGISICYDEAELRSGFEKAISFSKTKQVLVEKYVIAKEVTIFYILQGGKIMLSAMADRHTENGDKYTIPLPVLYTFPSVHLSAFQSSYNQKMIDAFQSIGLKNGMVFIQAFVDGNEIKPYDIGFRLTGTQEYHILEQLCGYNPLKMMVDYAFTVKMGNEDISSLVDPAFGGKYAFNITFLVKPCVIGKFMGLEEVTSMKGIIKVIKNHREGDEIPSTAIGTLNQVALRILGTADSKEGMKKLIRLITDTIDIESAEGESVLLPIINIEEI
ncbi:MAG TPA: hypothetical protein VIK89_07755 [Cytophagaceae bacterium]